MRISLQARLFIAFLAVLVGLPAFVYFVIYDHRNEPFCHKVVLVGLGNFLEEQKTDVLPNVDGHSAGSMVSMYKYWGDEPWEEKYRYIPGLRKDDPGDLVLMYMLVPTRYTAHDTPQTIFAKKGWVLIPLDFAGLGFGKRVDRDIPMWGEQCEMVSLPELCDRVKKTLNFLREHERPNWQTVVEEHEKFLNQMENGSH